MTHCLQRTGFQSQHSFIQHVLNALETLKQEIKYYGLKDVEPSTKNVLQ